MSLFLISEKPIVVSPSLAATIGLEEAILLQLLHETSMLSASTTSRLSDTVTRWSSLNEQQLSELLPFWTDLDIQRISKSLVDKEMVQLDSPPYRQSRCLRFTISQSASKANHQAAAATDKISRSNNINRSNNIAGVRSDPRSYGANFISPGWRPDTDILAKLAEHTIPADFAHSQLSEFVTYWQDRQVVSHSWGAKFIKHVHRAWRHHQQDTRFQPDIQQAPAQLQKGWQPSEDAIEIMERTGIHRHFIQDAIPEFVLYWEERGEANTTWNSKFLKHVKRQWARYTSTLQHDTEPRRIPEDWQPDEDVYEILTMANIDIDFARSLLKEFVLFWRDSNQLHASWNTKFLQHVKFQWARQHQMACNLAGNFTGNLAGKNGNAGQQNAYTAGHGTGQGFIEKHTDRSWADGL